MTRDFRKATDDLFATITHEELAKELGCSVAAIRQARRAPGTPAFRNPPANWEDRVRKLALAQAKRFTRLAERFTKGE